MRLYVFSPAFHIRPKNTDFQYFRMLAGMERYVDGLSVYLSRSLRFSAKHSLHYGFGMVGSRLGIALPDVLLRSEQGAASRRDIARARPDVIFGHSPSNVPDLPLVVQGGPMFPEQMKLQGRTEESIAREKAAKLRSIGRSQLVTYHAKAMADSILDFAPEIRDKVRIVPFFLPHLRTVEREEIDRRFENLSRIRLLFVGREARRKGLPAVLDAFQTADAAHPGRLELKIISSFADGPVPIPSMPNITHVAVATREQVGAEMRQSHLLLMPSVDESYGWVYLEAMAAGAVALACDLPSQREIMAEGRAGLLVTPTPEDVTDALLKLLAEPAAMRALAIAGWERVRTTYAPGIVAQGMMEVAQEAVERFRAAKR